MREKNNDCENYIPQKLTPCGKEFIIRMGQFLLVT